MHAHAHAHAPGHPHAHIATIIRESASVLRYTYIVLCFFYRPKEWLFTNLVLEEAYPTRIERIYFGLCVYSTEIATGYMKFKYSSALWGNYMPLWPGQALRAPGDWDSHDFYTLGTMKVVRLSALSTGCLYPEGRSLVIIFVTGWVDPKMITIQAILIASKIYPFLSGLLHCVPYILLPCSIRVLKVSVRELSR